MSGLRTDAGDLLFCGVNREGTIMEKVKTLIIDDEMLALEFLENLIDWEKTGFQIVGTAMSAEGGLQLFGEYMPDLVITDICMPDKNGLELCREFRLMKPDVKLIILTAYKNFDYAQIAIEVGVMDYIVKHEITAEALQEKLAKVLAVFEDSYRESQKKLRQEVKQLMFGGNKNQDAVQELSKKLDDDTKYFVVFVYFHDDSRNTLSINNGRYICLDGMQHIADFEMNESIYICLFSINRSVYLFHLVELKKQAGTMISNREETHKNDAVCLINIVQKKAALLEEAYTMCLKYKEYMKLMSIREKLIVISVKEREILKREDCFSDYQEELFLINMCVQKKEIYSAVERLRMLYLVHLKQTGSIRDIHLCGQSVLYIMIKALITQEPGMQTEEDVCRYQLSQCESLEEIFGFFRSKFEVLLARKEDGRYRSCSDKIKSAVGFIHENYMKSIGINEIAQYIGVSESYLVKNFKKEMDETILDYLTEVRINAAKEQLINTSSKIYEVAEKTGYNTSQYFSMVFMKKTGMTPKQYKEIYSGKE